MKRGILFTAVALCHVAAAVAVPLVVSAHGRAAMAGVVALWGLGAAGLAFYVAATNNGGRHNAP